MFDRLLEACNRKAFLGLLALSTLLLASTGAFAAPILLSATATYQEGGTNDNESDSFTISNVSDPGVEILSIVLSLPANTIFDTAGGGSGTSPAHEFIATAGQPSGGSFTLAGGSVADGATSLSISFTGFGPGESFGFTIDVDNTTPTGGGVANIEARRTVTGAELAGAQISITFGGFGGSPVALIGTFSETGQFTAAASVQRIVEGSASAAVPEPASVGLLGLGFLGVTAVRRLRRHR